MIAAITPFLLLVAFILLLLVSLSVPIIKSIYLLKLAANVSEGFGPVSVNANANVRFGVWGYCVSQIQASAAGRTLSRPGECSKAHLGFTLDSTVADALQVSGIENDLSRGITAVLVLHPIACALTFLALAFSLTMLFRRSLGTRLCSGVTLGVSILASVLTTIVFLIDVIFVAVVRKKIRDATDGDVSATWGSATWMTLTAAILLWVSCVGACCGIFGIRNRRRKHDPETY